ncbi:response regulator transcription factor [Amycolatopsis sp. NPDC059657]|uniref:response regulator n=1 Tax=Amycolatopsis sp. NPDC059657 TaxID=3346899 RepID=UPI003673231A
MVRDDGAGPARVLIADQDPRVRAALRAFLRAHPGFDVVAEAGSSTAALTLARECGPTVALVDVSQLDKGERLELVRALTGELRIPVVAIGFEGRVRAGALEAGAFRFLDKGSVSELLLPALEQAADHVA